MATDQQVQELVHRIEEGRWVKWVKLGVLLAVMTALFGAFVLDPWGWGLYKGFNHPKAMEQAQIARELARGNGFSTKMVRPLAYTQLKFNKGFVPPNKMPDTFQAPLWPATLAPFLRVMKVWPEFVPGSLSPLRMPWLHAPTKDRWEMSTRDYVYVGDRIISAVAVLFFFLSIFVNYFTARRLFDGHIAIWTVALMLGCSLFWQYAISGLPQMFMAFLFSTALYLLVRAMEAREQGVWPWGWLAGVAFLFGLLTLAHGLAAWAFAGALLFCVIYFKPRWGTALLMGAVFMAVYSPWILRNYKVSGSPCGISAYSALVQIRAGTESAIMRSSDLDLSGVSPTTFRRKIQTQMAGQMGNLFSSFGNVMVVPVFFLALMHLFKNPLPRTFRWALLSMWVFSLIGMSTIGVDDAGTGVSSTDLNVLFIPMFAAFGMAFVLVMWSRLEINVALVRYAFFVLIFGICTLPLLNNFTTGNKSPVQWPPYVPPYIAIMRDWTTPNEVIASDMPWAVAWYADRKSLWLPMTIQSFLDFHDFERLGGKVAGIYLTPITGNSQLIGDIVKGDYKDWAPFILRNVGIKDFPLRAGTAMPVDNQCIFYSDRDRWTDRAD